MAFTTLSATGLQQNIPSPTRPEDLYNLERIDKDKCVSKYAPGILVKYGANYDAEVHALQFAYQRFSIHTPYVLRHAPFPKNFVEPWNWEKGLWYFLMEECPDVPLIIVIDDMTSTELDHIADQLLVILNEMRSCASTTLGSAIDAPYNNWFFPYPVNPPDTFSRVSEYLDYFRSVLLEVCSPEFMDGLFRDLLTDVPICFAHGDLFPRNIFMDGTRITAIIDWETAGFYPEFWEYCRMNDPQWMTPGWPHVLSRIFPGLC